MNRYYSLLFLIVFGFINICQATKPGESTAAINPGEPIVATKPGEQPVVTNPVVTNPGESLAATKPGEQPVVTNPVVTNPIVTKPGEPIVATKPGEQPVVNNPVVTKPGESTVATKPDESTATTNSVVTNLGESIVALLQKPGTTKKQVLDLIAPIAPDSPEAERVLTYKMKPVKSRGGFTTSSTYSFLESIVCLLPGKLENLRRRGVACLTLNELLEISKKLWALNPVIASSVKGSVNGSIDRIDLDEAPIMHKLIAKLFDAYESRSTNVANFLHAYITFIVTSYPQTLMVTNSLGNTTLHYLQSFIGTKRGEETHAKALIKEFLQIKGIEEVIDIQNNEGSTALDVALKTNHKYAHALLEKGANPLILNRKGTCALDHMVENIEGNVKADKNKSSVTPENHPLDRIVENTKGGINADKNQLLSEALKHHQEGVTQYLSTKNKKSLLGPLKSTTSSGSSTSIIMRSRYWIAGFSILIALGLVSWYVEKRKKKEDVHVQEMEKELLNKDPSVQSA